MRTVSQVMEYLNKQDWKDEFFKYAGTKLSLDERLLEEAFDWDDTPQGRAFWIIIAKEYLDWYYSEKKVISWDEFEKTEPVLAAIPIICMPEFLAYKKLIQLRDQWLIAENLTKSKKVFKIMCRNNELIIYTQLLVNVVNGLSFPSMEMANEFRDTFEDLLEIAKPLL